MNLLSAKTELKMLKAYAAYAYLGKILKRRMTYSLVVLKEQAQQ